MNFRTIIHFIALILPSLCYAAVPSYIEGDTIENICKKVVCNKELNKTYKSYYAKQFNKAFAVSSYKSGNKYYIDYASWTYQYPNRTVAHSTALSACKKHGKNCKVLFLNNAIYDEDLYVLLTQTTISKSYSSNSSKKIPANAYATNSTPEGWKCLATYTKSGNSCIKQSSSSNNSKKIPLNAYATGFESQGWKCNSGYTQSGHNCIKSSKSNSSIQTNNEYVSNNSAKQSNEKYVADTLQGKGVLGKILSWVGLTKNNSSLTKSSSQKKVYIPANATASGANGWLCNNGYKRSGNSCIKKITIPANAYASGSGWKCLSGYKKSGNSCIKQLYIPTNAYAYGNSWKCYEGFKKVGSRCEKLTWKDGDYWDQEVRPGVSRVMALGIILSEMGNNNRSNTNFKNTLINSSPKLNPTPTFGYRYGEWLYDSNNNFMGYIKNGNTYDKSMRSTGTIRNNNIYNNTGNYVGPLGQDYKPGNVDFFD